MRKLSVTDGETGGGGGGGGGYYNISSPGPSVRREIKRPKGLELKMLV